MEMFKPGDLVEAISGGPVMMVETDRGGGKFTLTWFEDKRPRSIVLPAELLRPVERPTPDDAADAHRLPQAIVALEGRVAALEENVAARGYDTRPMYEVHEGKIQGLESRI